jgi:uncharacterized SAM-dependent methyltransferase
MEIKIFIGSSNELKSQRIKLELEIYRQSQLKANYEFKPEMWEFMDHAMTKGDFQKEINEKLLKNSAIVIIMIKNKLGRYTREEFKITYDTLDKKIVNDNNQKLYVYFLKTKQESTDVKNFKEELKNAGKYPIEVKDIGELKSHFIQQLDIYIKNLEENKGNFKPSPTKKKSKKFNMPSNICFGSSILDNSNETNTKLILNSLREGQPVPMEFFYNSDVGAIRWKNLCESADYLSYELSKKFIKNNSIDIFNKIGKNFFDNSLDIISLGPGNGIKDGYFLKALLNYTKQENVNCYLFDISMKMLHIAAYNLKNHKEFSKLNERVKIQYIHSLFENIYFSAEMIKDSESSKIYLLLGNTLGNTSQEIVFLNKIKSVMNKEDILLLEVRLSNGNNDKIRAEGEKEGDYFNLTPLEVLGVDCDRAKIDIKDSEKISQIDGTKSITIIYNDLVHKNKMRNEELMRREVILSQINYFQDDKLQTTLENSFNIKEFFNNDGLGFYVLEKR